MSGANISWQLIQLLNVMLYSVFAMFLFECNTELSNQARWHRHQKLFADFLVIFLCGVILCVLLIQLHYGLIRSYILLGICLGLFIYRVLLRNVSNVCCKYIAILLLWFFAQFTKIFLAPWKKLFIMLNCYGKKLKKHIWKQNELHFQEETMVEYTMKEK